MQYFIDCLNMDNIKIRYKALVNRFEEYKTTGSKNNLDEIREKYNSETVNSHKRIAIHS